MEASFEPGYDPALELAKRHTKVKPATTDLDPEEPWTEYIRRKEQDLIDLVVKGEEPGHYFMLLGPKGCGKGTMIFEAMGAIQADGVSMFFRLRLGKALNYEYNEDTQTGLFQRRDPREGGPALDIERALNKLEKVALRCAERRGKPLVLIINNIHFFQNDEDGRNMILQLQQKAEAWAASGILTVVFSSDDFWPFHVMRKYASRMHVMSVTDLTQEDARKALTRIRRDANKGSVSDSDVLETVDVIGGRLSYLNRVAKSKEMVEMAKHMMTVEKGWILSRIGLIPDCDDDVMDEQKWSSCSWLLLQEFVKLRRAQEKERDEAVARGELNPDKLPELPLPSMSWYKARQIMTRADFMEDLDRANIIAIDINHDVRPDSMLTLQVAMEVVEEEGFDDLLNNVRDRIDEIESLHRTRELTFKDVGKGDMIRFALDKDGPLYVNIRDDKKDDEEDDDDDDD
ncbi:hypothetical protein DFP72DRAFT_883554 [Ephemerocybe angulata]|uniref:AAA protein C-terminal winged helix domain-containing protein n=1 Tax=Ephemerocybe angulata TaxID=980116 RepID=A0A8H6MCM2_9AGAR|nr:hypothetical protein DFP72DRAFT_883554 [Tulosesus angulatus]